MSFEIIPHQPMEEYRKRPGVNSSLLKMTLEESLKTVQAYIKGEIEYQSDAMKFGNAFHSLVLEGKRDYVVRPEEYAFGKRWTMSAQFCKDWVAKQTLPILSKAEEDNLKGMSDAIHAEPELAPYLIGKCELSVFVREHGKDLKARIDLLPDDPDGPVIDFKKTRSANPEAFVKQLYNMRYYVQAAFYLDVLKMAGQPRRQFWFVAVEDFHPFNVYICKLQDEMMGLVEYGREQYKAAYAKLMEAMGNSRWPSYGSSAAEEYLTPWMQKAIEEATA